MRTITLLIAVAAVAIGAQAEEVEIKGAFGIELGQVIPPGSSMIQGPDTRVRALSIRVASISTRLS